MGKCIGSGNQSSRKHCGGIVRGVLIHLAFGIYMRYAEGTLAWKGLVCIFIEALSVYLLVMLVSSLSGGLNASPLFDDANMTLSCVKFSFFTARGRGQMTYSTFPTSSSFVTCPLDIGGKMRVQVRNDYYLESERLHLPPPRCDLVEQRHYVPDNSALSRQCLLPLR